MRKSRNRSTLILVFTLLVLVGGCKSKDAPSSSQPTARQSQSKPKPVQMQATSSQNLAVQGQQFDFSDKRDPFKPFVVEVKQPAVNAKATGGLPIQNHEVSQFRIAGIIVGLKENIAQVLDPTGKAYTLKKGMVIGKYDGRVTKIAATYIEVKERYREDSGRIKFRTVRLSIPKKN